MQQRLLQIKNMVDQEIDNALKNENPLIDALYKSALYSAAGGKRVRAQLHYLVGALFNVPENKMLKSACAIELIHAASLIMDDLPYMKDSQLRRGKPANHVVFGQDVALLASIGLISKALEQVLADDGLSEAEKNKTVATLSASFGFEGLAAGQFVDLKLKHKNVDVEILKFINHKKTAALFLAGAKAAALLGGADAEKLKAVEEFSTNIGFAFQIVNELLESGGRDSLVGKEGEQEKMNFVKLVGEDKAREYLKTFHSAARKSLTAFGTAADELNLFVDYLIERAL